MPTLTLPDGAQRTYDQAPTGMDVALSISPHLAKALVAVQVDGVLQDADGLIEQDAAVRIITAKDDLGLEVIRHSTAHLLAQAVKQLYPSAQVTIGPVIENGFYYDFFYPPGFNPEDLEAIEARMTALAQAALPVKYKAVARDEAIQYFEGLGEQYKAEIIRDIPPEETLTLYTQGDFTDLCRGPHVPNTSHLRAFKLTSLAGAYWRGDSNNPMLQRVYGTAWAEPKQLRQYLKRLEEAKRRDHRVLGKKMDLFHIQEEAPGMIFWHPRGWRLYQLVRAYIRKRYEAYGYQEVWTPQLVDMSLWERSGHQAKFSEEMFSIETDSRTYALKPMNCPCHVQLFNQGLRSYRELPLRLAELGSCHRAEPSGTLHGLMRLRHFVQDDGHIFCTEAQIGAEVSAFIEQVQQTYRDFGFDSVSVVLSTRPASRVGDDAVWDKAEQALETVLNESGVAWTLCPGEGAFYGPKIEFALKDCLERVWQCGTVQLDFSMADRLEAHYIAEDGSRQVPVMIHRAMLGSLERFIGIILEETEGVLPLWLAPIQVVVASVTDDTADYALDVVKKLMAAGVRAESDLRNEKIGFKIREHTIARVPLLAVCGQKEVDAETVSIRRQSGEQLPVMSVADLIKQVKDTCP